MQQQDEKKARKEAIKKLRELRKEAIERATTRMKEQKRITDSIKAELLGGDKTVPELSAATGIPSASVMWTVATLKKYGQVVEGDAAASYFRYRLAAGGKAEEAGREAPGES
ncbi:MAG: winged helix-turn-helix domain-containing protein [Deltaproteobacteria bacterium]|jgi:hypothetical protein|nr:winged helix-turn-helix domain-containing protein [Deltaproteobacteria bacterium]MDA8307569.1 winged helix-turn-helix domain-containing protein [Deltaproteobacteria bacterium]